MELVCQSRNKSAGPNVSLIAASERDACLFRVLTPLRQCSAIALKAYPARFGISPRSEPETFLPDMSLSVHLYIQFVWPQRFIITTTHPTSFSSTALTPTLQNVLSIHSACNTCRPPCIANNMANTTRNGYNQASNVHHILPSCTWAPSLTCHYIAH